MFVLQGLDMSLCDYDGRTALHLAAAEGQLPCVEVLHINIIIIILDTLAIVIITIGHHNALLPSSWLGPAGWRWLLWTGGNPSQL